MNISNAKIHCFGDNINTDIIISGQYLRNANEESFREHVFENLKGKGYCKKINKGDVIIAGKNFGCGSSREQAALAIKHSGISAIFAKSFGRIFYRNIINQGVLAVNIKNIDEGILNRITDGEKITVSFDESKAFIGDEVIEFDKPSKFLLNIIEAGGLLNYAKEKDCGNTW